MKNCSCCNKRKEESNFRLGRNQCKQCDAIKGKQYRIANDNKLHEKHQCQCGGNYTHDHKSKHEQSTKRKIFIKNGFVPLKKSEYIVMKTWLNDDEVLNLLSTIDNKLKQKLNHAKINQKEPLKTVKYFDDEGKPKEIKVSELDIDKIKEIAN